jgi:hypothetical protein
MLNLQAALGDKGAEAERAEQESEASRRRVSELESLKTTVDGKTLSEAEKTFLEAEEKKIGSRVEERFETRMNEWKNSELPKMVSHESIRLLGDVLDVLSGPGPHTYPNEISDAGIARKVEEILKKAVEGRMNVEFYKRVEEASTKEAQMKLAQLKAVEWPNFLKDTVGPRAERLEAEIRSNVLELIKGAWRTSCDKCGTELELSLAAAEMESLLRPGFMMMECGNQTCKDWFGRHKIKVSLQDLLQSVLIQ